MQNIHSLLKTPFSCKEIDLRNNQWHIGIPNRAGWYFIETNAPLDILTKLPAPPSIYTNDDGKEKMCRNYNISARAQALIAIADSGIVISGTEFRYVYSGMAKNLLNRAREHTFGHRGTAGLALANYPELLLYRFKFHYLENSIPKLSSAHADVTLKLGEQIWRASNGWPILCSG